MKRIILSLATLLCSSALWAQNLQKETLELDGSQGKLYSILEYPAQVQDDVKYPLVIICHGFTASCETPLIETLAKDITEAGIATLRFDFNGHGKSDGNFRDMTVLNEIEDLKDVISWAQRQQWVENISLVGHSQGGVVVSMTAGELGDSVIKAEVLLAPAAVLRDDAIRGNVMGARFNPWDLKGDFVPLPMKNSNGQPYRLGKEYIESAMNLPIYKIASRYTGPTLIIHGNHDSVVPYTYGERYHFNIKGSKLKIIEGENHGFTETMDETATYVANWLKKQLLPSQDS